MNSFLSKFVKKYEIRLKHFSSRRNLYVILYDELDEIKKKKYEDTETKATSHAFEMICNWLNKHSIDFPLDSWKLIVYLSRVVRYTTTKNNRQKQFKTTDWIQLITMYQFNGVNSTNKIKQNSSNMYFFPPSNLHKKNRK